MALPETFYAVHEEREDIPPQYEWYQELDSAKTDAVELAESNNTPVLVTEIMVRSIYRTETTVTLGKI